MLGGRGRGHKPARDWKCWECPTGNFSCKSFLWVCSSSAGSAASLVGYAQHGALGGTIPHSASIDHIQTAEIQKSLMVSWVLVYLWVGRRIIQHQGHHCLPVNVDLALPFPSTFLSVSRSYRSAGPTSAIHTILPQQWGVCSWKHWGVLCNV